MFPHRISTIFVAALIATSLGACSSGSGAGSAADKGDSGSAQQVDAGKKAKTKAGDACSLLTKEQAAGIVGTEVSDGTMGAYGCTWTATEATLPPRLLTVSVLPKGEHEKTKDMSEGSEAGVGDDAYWLGGILAVKAADLDLSFTATNKDLDVAKEKTLAAAKLVVANLG